MTEILLDTNVLAELGRLRPEPHVAGLLRTWAPRAAIASVTWDEVVFGVERLPGGNRRSYLAAVAEDIGSTFTVLPFDRAAAEWHARERARLLGIGRTPSWPDGQIAATAATNGLRLVTRNVSDFRDFDGLTVESWWS